MSHVWTILRRDLVGLFTTWPAYILLAVYAAAAGMWFYAALAGFLIRQQQYQALGAVQYLAQYNLNDEVITPALASCSVILLVVIPGLAARSFSQERASGSIELLLTSPVRMWEVVIGKFLAIMSTVMVAVGISGLYVALLFFYGDPELARTLGGLLSLLLYATVLAAICCFVSSLTSSMMLAFVLGFVACLVLLVIGQFSVENESLRAVLSWISTGTHFEPGIAGNLRSEDLGYFATLTLAFLTLTHAATDSLRWR